MDYSELVKRARELERPYGERTAYERQLGQLVTALADAVEELQAEHDEEAGAWGQVIKDAHAERDRLADSIREHRDHDFKGDPFIVGPARYVSEMRRVNERLWALVDVAADDREDGR